MTLNYIDVSTVILEKQRPILILQSLFKTTDCYWIINHFSYKLWNGIIIPFLSVFQNGYRSSFPFYGYKYFYFTQDRFCKSCLRLSNEFDSLGNCQECQTTIQTKQFRCLFQKAGLPFGGICHPNEEPLCGDRTICELYCQPEHVIYLGRFGQQFKIGITGRYRGNDQKGYLFRLFDQGLDEVIVFAKDTRPLNLLDAQTYELEIAQIFHIPTFITFEDKLTQLEFNLPSNSLVQIGHEIQEQFPDLSIIDHCFPTDYLPYSKEIERSIPDIIVQSELQLDPLNVTGIVYYTRGELAIIKESQDHFILINLRKLIGKAYYDSEG